MKSLRRSLNSSNHNHGHSSGSGHGPGPSYSGHSHSGSHGNTHPTATLGYPSANGLPGASASNPLSRPTDKVAPPQKVIKALNSHRSTNPQELSYTKGDFWYVIGEREGWYEALNPITSSRGLVPKEDFEEFSKGGRQATMTAQSPTQQHSRSMSQSQNNGGAGRAPPAMQPHPAPGPSHTPTSSGGAVVNVPGFNPMSPGGKKHQPLYAIVQYDFHAERPDELEAKAGEPIVVIAQSNHEWFVAKPIGRLGGPGLIPVAFVEIRDPVSGKPVDVFPSTIPQVEEWKKATAEYKAAAIPLGRLDLHPDQRVANSPFQAASSSGHGHGDDQDERTTIASSTATAKGKRRSDPAASHTTKSSGSVNRAPSETTTNGTRGYKPEHDPMLPQGEFLELGVPSFHNESGNYWFRLHAAFLPDDSYESAYTLILYRTYEDFYDFQITLLDTFPKEAGRPANPDQSPPERMLPYMPGPVDEAIDDELTEYRRAELDSYVQALLDLREQGAGYILRHELIRSFFAAKYGDYCESTPRPDAVEELNDSMAAATIGGIRGNGNGNGNGTTAPPPGQVIGSGRHAHNAPPHTGGGNGWTFPTHAGSEGQQSQGVLARHPQATGNHTRNMSSSGGNINNLSVNTQNAQMHSTQTGYNPNVSAVTPVMSGPSATVPPSSPVPPPPRPTAAPQATAAAPPAPQPAAAPAASRPALSNAAFVKIKIYDRATDDLIALRVHPAVTYAELLDKVRARLGPGIHVLQYRVNGGTGPAASGVAAPCRQISDDRALSEWMASEEKLVLYAEQ